MEKVKKQKEGENMARFKEMEEMGGECIC